jgi:diguanylate cyclase (GGDEF)-like protein/PAS domain S-box-containing protein
VPDEADLSTEIRQVLEALHEGDPQYRLAVERAADAVLLVTREGLVVAVSARAAELLGRSRTALLSLSLTDVVEGEASGEDLFALLSLGPGPSMKRTLDARRGDGAEVELDVSARRLGDGRLLVSLGDPGASERRTVASFDDATREDPTPLAMGDVYHDGVTGLTSRFLVRDRLSVALAQSYRQKARVGVVHVDLDRFAATNATIGRDLGDRLLRSVGRRLEQVVREGDTVARAEADAFVLILSGLKHSDDVLRVGDKVLEALRRPFALPEREVSVTASVGASVFPEHGEQASSLLSLAREAADRARIAGGDGIEVCPPPAPENGYDPLELEAGLRAALGSGRLALDGAPEPAGILHYQPIIDLATSKVCAVEALLRWQHPRHGLVFPERFLSGADFTGLILAIEPWIFRTAAAQAMEWQRRVSTLRIAVNLSAAELRRRTLPDLVKAALEETGLAPHLLELELPEEAVVSGLPRSLDVLHRLKALGVSLVLDRMAVRSPFLGGLSELPVDGVKLDLSFLRERPAGPDDVALLGTICAVARALKLRVGALGVERQAHLDLLAKLGCVEAQGFHFGPPVAAPALGKRLARQPPSKDEGA